MAIRQQYANEELMHKLRSMLNDLPTLRTRAMKKLEHWREAAIKRLLARQRECCHHRYLNACVPLRLNRFCKSLYR